MMNELEKPKKIERSAEWRAKQSAAQKAAKASPEMRAKMSEAARLAYVQNPELRKVTAEAAHQAWQDPEFRMKRRATIKKRFEDPDFRKKMSDVQKEAWADPEVRARASKTLRAMRSTPEYRSAMSARQKKLLNDPETKQKMSESAAKRIQRGTNCGLGVQGWFFSQKTGRVVHHRSSYERQYYLYLEANSEVAWYEVECVRIPYITSDGRAKTYVPDVRIHWKSGIIELVEITAAWRLKSATRQLKLAAARRYCMSQGWEFSVVTEKHLSQLISNQADPPGIEEADRKAQRLTGEFSQDNTPDTSAGRPHTEADDIVQSQDESSGLGIKSPKLTEELP